MGYKLEHLTPGAIAIVATGRSFNVAKTSGLPRSQSKVFGEVSMILKAAIWERIGSGAKHLNGREMVAQSVAKEPKQPLTKTAQGIKSAKKGANKAAKVKLDEAAEIRTKTA